MNMDEYDKKALLTLTSGHSYGDVDAQLMAQVLGLAGESGEVVDKFKKILRDKAGRLSDADREDIIKELGDILWYTSVVAHLLGSSLEEVAQLNNEKLASRMQRDSIKGSGDNR